MANSINVWQKGDTDAGNERQHNIKDPVVVASLLPIALTGSQTISSVVVVAGDRVLVTGQAVKADNGIYLASDTAWTRAVDFNDDDDVVNGTMVLDAGSGIMYSTKVAAPFIIGTTDITFAPVSYAAASVLEVHTATVGQVVFTLANTYANTFDNLTVYIDGLWQEEGSSYTKTANNSVTLYPIPELPAGTKVAFRFNEVVENSDVIITDASIVTFTANGGTLTNVASTLDFLLDSLTGLGGLTNADTVDGLHAAASAAPNVLLALNSAAELAANLAGLANAAKILATPRAISLSGGATGSVSFDGSADVDIVTTIDLAGLAVITPSMLEPVTAGEYAIVEALSDPTSGLNDVVYKVLRSGVYKIYIRSGNSFDSLLGESGSDLSNTVTLLKNGLSETLSAANGTEASKLVTVASGDLITMTATTVTGSSTQDCRLRLCCAEFGYLYA